jgi:hypothetical protein
MNDFPDLLILANRGRLVAYRPTGEGHLEEVESLEPMEGNEKISDLVTDQAEAFPTDDSGTAGYESMPFTEEMEIRSLRQIAGKIEEVFAREEVRTWGFAAAPELNKAILEEVPAEILDSLSFNLRLDLTNSPPTDVHERFQEARETADQTR